MPLVENITLQPHPMDTWAKALDALITCAPGSEDEIRTYLGAAMRQLHVAGRKTNTPNLQVRLAGRLITACGLDVESLLEASTRANGKRLLSESEAISIAESVSRLAAVSRRPQGSAGYPSTPAHPGVLPPSARSHSPTAGGPAPAQAPGGVPASDTPRPSRHQSRPVDR